MLVAEKTFVFVERNKLSPGTLVCPPLCGERRGALPARGGQRSLVRAARPGRCLFCLVLATTCMHTEFVCMQSWINSIDPGMPFWVNTIDPRRHS
jgi:hypothetical protein